MKKLICLVLLISPVYVSLTAFAGSWSSGGGGTGFACFKTDAAASEVRDGADLNSRPDLLAQLDSLMPTDLFENRENMYVKPLPQELPRDYVERVIADRLKFTAPLFYQRLEIALANVEMGWTTRQSKLPNSNDTGAITQWPADTTTGPRGNGNTIGWSDCAQVQIAYRTTLSGKGASARLLVAVDSLLYNHIGEGNENSRIAGQGALLLHEALYLIGQSLGHKNSIDARRLTAALLSNTKIEEIQKYDQNFTKNSPGTVNPQGIAISNELNMDGFGAFKPGQFNSIMAAGVAGFQAAQRKMVADIAGRSDAEARAIMLKFPLTLKPAEALAAVGNVALGRGLIPDLETLGNERAPGHAQALFTVCAFTNVTVQSPENDTEQVFAVGTMFRRAKAFCRSGKVK